MFGERTLRTLLEQIMPELPDLTDEQLEHLEDPVTPEAQACMNVVDVLEDLELGELVDDVAPIVEKTLQVRALYCDHAITEDPVDGALEKREGTRRTIQLVRQALDVELDEDP